MTNMQQEPQYQPTPQE
jgi:hypothetical protein